MNTIQHKIKNIISKEQAPFPFSFTSGPESQTDVLFYKEAKQKKRRAFVLYHNPNDQKYAMQDAIANGNQEDFCTFNEDVARSLISDEALEKSSAYKTERSDGQRVFDYKFWLGIAVSFFGSAGLLSLLLKSVKENLFVRYLVIGIAAFCLTIGIISLVKKAKKQKETKKEALKKIRKTIDLSIVTENASSRSFIYGNTPIFITRMPAADVNDNMLWVFFKAYLKNLPSKEAISFIALKTIQIPYRALNENNALDHIRDKDKTDLLSLNKDFIISFNALVPLTEKEKTQLVTENQVRNIYKLYRNRGRDFILDALNNNSIQYDYDKDDLLSEIYSEMKGITDDNKKDYDFVVTYLSHIKNLISYSSSFEIRFYTPIVLNKFLSDAITQKIADACPSIDRMELKNICLEIWKKYQDRILVISDMENELFKQRNESSQSLDIRPAELALESFLGYLFNLDSNIQDVIYSEVSDELHSFLSDLLEWSHAYVDSATHHFITSFYLSAIQNLLNLNIRKGYFPDNYLLLGVVRGFYSEVKEAFFTEEEKNNFYKFYRSENVKRAFLLNAVTVPSISAGEMSLYGTTSNPCREMHVEYLKTLLDLDNAPLKRIVAPSSFELFGSKGGCDEYYSLLRQNNEDEAISFYCSLYETLNFMATAVYPLFCFLKSEGREGDCTLKTKDALLYEIKQSGEKLFNKSQKQIRDLFASPNTTTKFLFCMVLDCELFYLIYDLIPCLKSKEVEDRDFVFIGSVKSPDYLIVDQAAYVIPIPSRLSSNVFTDLVDGVSHIGYIAFFAKLYLFIINWTYVSEPNEQMIKNFFAQNLKDIRLVFDVDKMESKIHDRKMFGKIGSFLFNTSRQLDSKVFESVCGFVKDMANNTTIKELKDLVRFVINKEEFSFADEKMLEGYVSEIAEYTSNTCFLVFDRLSERYPEAYKYIKMVSNSIANSTYVRHLTLLIDAINYLEDNGIQHDGTLINLVLDRITPDVFGQKINTVLDDYYVFFNRYKREIEDLKGEEFYEETKELIKLKIVKNNHYIAQDLYYHLQKESSYLLIYAQQFLSMAFMGREHVNGGSFSQWSISLEKDGHYYLNADYLDYLNSLKEDEATISEEIKLKVLSDLIDLLSSDLKKYFRLSDEDRKTHISLLNSLMMKLFSGKNKKG